jgi:hypothetical protein
MNVEGTGERGCPTVGKKAHTQKAKDEYRKKDVAEFARQVPIQEGECYAGFRVVHNTQERERLLQYVQKAVVLAALGRAAGIPSRLVFVVIRNHRAPEQLAIFCSHSALTTRASEGRRRNTGFLPVFSRAPSSSLLRRHDRDSRFVA